MLREFTNLPLNEKKQELNKYSGIKKFRNIRNIEQYLINKHFLTYLYFNARGNSKELSDYFVSYIERFINDYDHNEIEIVKSFFQNNIKRKYIELTPEIAKRLDDEIGINISKDKNGFPIIFDISFETRYDRIRSRPNFEEEEDQEYYEDDELSISVKRMRL